MSRKAPEVTKDDKDFAKSLLVLLEMDKECGLDVLEKLIAAARHWGKGLS